MGAGWVPGVSWRAGVPGAAATLDTSGWRAGASGRHQGCASGLSGPNHQAPRRQRSNSAQAGLYGGILGVFCHLHEVYSPASDNAQYVKFFCQ